jgi:hypothetical protein
MSQTGVLKSLVKTDNEYNGLYRHDIQFENDPTTFIVWRSNDRPISFKPGDTVNYEVTDASKKKIKFLKSPQATQSKAPASSGAKGGFTRSADTNRSIMAQTCLKASVDFFKDRPNSSLEDVSDGMEYLLARLEGLLSGNKPAQARPSIPTDFLDKLPN